MSDLENLVNQCKNFINRNSFPSYVDLKNIISKQLPYYYSTFEIKHFYICKTIYENLFNKNLIKEYCALLQNYENDKNIKMIKDIVNLIYTKNSDGQNNFLNIIVEYLFYNLIDN
jgi:hypothetical protein